MLYIPPLSSVGNPSPIFSRLVPHRSLSISWYLIFSLLALPFLPERKGKEGTETRDNLGFCSTRSVVSFDTRCSLLASFDGPWFVPDFFCFRLAIESVFAFAFLLFSSALSSALCSPNLDLTVSLSRLANIDVPLRSCCFSPRTQALKNKKRKGRSLSSRCILPSPHPPSLSSSLPHLEERVLRPSLRLEARQLLDELLERDRDVGARLLASVVPVADVD